MSTFSAHVTGDGNQARVTRDEGLASLDGEFHVAKIDFGSLTVNLTDREARRLWEDLGEIYAARTPGECDGCGRTDGQHKMGCVYRPGKGAIFTASRNDDGTFTADTALTPGEVETPEQIAERISSQRSIGAFSGLDANTRRIARAAALQAAKAARGLNESTPFRPTDSRKLDPKPFRNGRPETKSAQIFPGAIFQPGIDFNQDRENYPAAIFEMPKEGNQ